MPKNLNTCKTLGQHYVTSFSEDVLNGYVTNPNPTLTLTPNPNQINPKIQKETTLEIDQMT
jgi:hypothetical protein